MGVEPEYNAAILAIADSMQRGVSADRTVVWEWKSLYYL